MQMLRILWFALFASTGVLAGVVVAVGGTLEPGISTTLPVGLAISAIFAAVLSVVLPARFHRQALRAQKLTVVEEVDQTSAFANYRGALGKRRVFQEPSAARRAAVATMQVPMIVGLALAESVAIDGAIIGFLGFDFIQAAPFFLASGALILARFPRETSIYRALETVFDAKLPS
jgi:hypothetical protein